MRLIPRNTKVQTSFYKGITIADVILGLVGLGLVACRGEQPAVPPVYRPRHRLPVRSAVYPRRGGAHLQMRSLLGAAHFQQKEIHGERQRRGEYPKHCPLRADRRELYREQRRRVYGRARNQAHRIPPARSEQTELSHRRRAYERTHERGRKSGSRHRQTRKAARFRQTYSGRP